MRAGLVLAALLAALASLHTVLNDVSWWFAGAAFALIVVAVATLARTLTRRRWIPPLAALVASVVALTAVYASDVAFLALIPNAEVMARFSAISASGFDSIATQATPADPQVGIVFLIVLVVIFCALAATGALAIGAPALTALPLLGLLVVPVAVRPEIADPLWFVIALVIYLVMLRFGRRRASVPLSLAAGAVVVLGSLLVPSFLPAVDTDEAVTAGGVATGINPLINLGSDLRRGDPVTAVTYTTDSEVGVYLRLATLDTFNGRSWSPAMVETGDEGNTIDAFPSPIGLDDTVLRADREVVIEVGDIAGRWLPLPYPATSVTGTSGDWFWEPDGLSARSSNTSVRGQTYAAQFIDVEPTLAQLQVAVPNPGVNAERDLQLPARMPSIITDTAAAIADGKTSSYDIALALQDYFQSGDFTYSEDAPVEEGYDGTGTDIIARFLERKAGYCVHYSSAMAVMARTLGIPARVAVGFQPGEGTEVDGVTVYTVSSHDLHAWPELYFEGVGWLRFEPTPGRGEVPDYETELPVDDPTTPENEAAPPVPTTTPTAAAAPERPDVEIDPVTGQPVVPTAVANPLPAVLLSILGVLVLLAAAPVTARAIIRRGRLARVRRGDDAATAAWDEVRDTARDHGWAAPDTETPRDFADRLAAVITGHENVVDGFRADVELSAFAPPGRGAPTVAELRAIRRAIAGTVGPRDRVRAVFLPASLLARFRWDPEA